VAFSEKTQRELKIGHTSPGWQENHPVEPSMEESMVKAMAMGEAGNQPVRTSMMEMKYQMTLIETKELLARHNYDPG